MKELNEMNGEELMRLYFDIIKELKQKNIIHSKNIIGDLGEFVARVFYVPPKYKELSPQKNNNKDTDAIDTDNKTYSIKTTSIKQTSMFHNLPSPGEPIPQTPNFDYVIIVDYSDFTNLRGIYEITWAQFWDLKKWNSTNKAWYLRINKELLGVCKTIYTSQ
ncbi:MAG: hypothetical protein A2Y33_01295 [Spirochaetes bacterium GWF1_51_8]|nr:MAG: hypothetical protein A2Y33_01295 [Spirochaetes bacterium GWF1_51_8]